MRGLLGEKLGHSFSKIIHEKLDNKEYNLFEVSDLDSFFHDNRIDALNVTIPYKSDVIKYLDSLEGVAADIQIVNTIVRQGDKLIGYNTDYLGFDYLLSKHKISIGSKVIGILGNGSTMKTIKYYCEQHNASKILVFARSPKQGEYTFNDLELLKDINVLINATPNGMYPNNYESNLVPFDAMEHLECVIDLVYNPLTTKFMQTAMERKIKAVNGLTMLVSQAVYANELFNDVKHNDSVFQDVYHDILLQQLNIVVIGLPMSGKTYISKALAKKYHKDFIDIDSLIEQKMNKSIPDIFQDEGEQAFRLVETNFVLDVSKELNKAISPGGGIVLNKENMLALRQNGVIVFLDVPLKDLEKRNPKNRPLLKNKKNIAKLYTERYNLYNTYCDIKISKVGFNEDKTLSDIEVKLNEYINTQWS